MKDDTSLPAAASPCGHTHPTHPAGMARTALCLENISRPFADIGAHDDIVAALENAHAADASCEDLLFAQAHLLDALFKRLVYRDIHSPWKYPDGTPKLDEDKLTLALRSQQLARTTINALSLVRARKRKHDHTN